MTNPITQFDSFKSDDDNVNHFDDSVINCLKNTCLNNFQMKILVVAEMQSGSWNDWRFLISGHNLGFSET